jgi:hypothetical protein
VGLARATALLALLALALAGCGSGSSSTSSVAGAAGPVTTSTTRAASSTTASTTAVHHRAHKHKRAATTTTATSTTSTTATSSTATSTDAAGTATGVVQANPNPTPAGTAAAPAGLAQTVGYGTYELCQGSCSGSVPAALRRALKLPGSCASSAAAGPVRPVGATQLTVQPFIGSSWLAGRVTWSAAGSYTGPVLIRGRELGGSGAVGFGEGRTPYDELQLLTSGQGAPSVPGGGRSWLSYTRVRSPGCYAYQVDGTSFSSVIAFRVVR